MSYPSLRKLYYTSKDEYDSIYKNRFTSENTIHFNFNINGNSAFFFYHSEIMKMISEISFLDKKVNEILKNVLPRAAQMEYLKKSLIDEVLYTNEIEGIISTRKEINSIINDLEKKTIKSTLNKPQKMKSLIHKYILLMQEDGFIKTPEEVRKLYDDLVIEDILAYDENDKPDGDIFRAKGVEVKNEVTGKTMHEGVMPEVKIITMMSSALEILNNESIEPLIRIAIFHYVFSYIHPFYDGNGRTNRYISSLYLKKYYSSIISYRLSLTIKENKSQYYEAFHHTNDVKNLGDISTFVYEFVNIVKKSFEVTIDYLYKKKTELNERENQIKNLDLKEKASQILWLLAQVDVFKGQALGIQEINKFYHFSLTTTREIVLKLVKAGYIKENKDSRKKVYYFSLT